MKSIISKIKAVHVIILLLLLILIKLNVIANSLGGINSGIGLDSVSRLLKDIKSEVQSINWNGVRISR